MRVTLLKSRSYFRIPHKYVMTFFCVTVVSLFVGAIYFTKNEIYESINFARSTREIIKYECPTEDNKMMIPIEQMMTAPQILEMDNPKLLKKVRQQYLFPPSEKHYNLRENIEDPSMGQSTEIQKILGPMRNGFFIECGALDGETRSNTLVFEKSFGWEGILIEGDPKNFNLVVNKRRKAWTVPSCLSIFPYPNVVMFKQAFNIGKISTKDINSDTFGYAKVQCLPLYTILLAVNRTKVDYFSLDIEGHELEVLRTIPWDKVNITTLSVEFIHGNEEKNVLQSYMRDKGYLVYSEVIHPGNLANDFIFYHPALLPEPL